MGIYSHNKSNSEESDKEWRPKEAKAPGTSAKMQRDEWKSGFLGQEVYSFLSHHITWEDIRWTECALTPFYSCLGQDLYNAIEG